MVSNPKGMANNLLKKGHTLHVYNRTKSVALEFKEAAAEAGFDSVTVKDTPAEVVEASTVTYGMLADPVAAEAVVFGAGGVLETMGDGKAYVDCSTVDAACSKKIGDAVQEKGGRFLEAPVSGSKKPAADAQLIFLCAGSQSLYDEVLADQLVPVMGKMSKYLGENVGQGAR